MLANKKYTPSFYTVQEYLNLLKASDTKVEYLNGQIRYMAGGTINHSLLCANASGIIRNGLKGKPCNVFSPDLKVYIENKNSYVLPDATVICGDIETSEHDKNAVTNPSLIVEVLSESTKSYDYAEKFALYRSIQSLKEYVLISSMEKKVEVFTKKEGKHIWQIKSYPEISNIITLESIDCTIDIDELYEGLKF